MFIKTLLNIIKTNNKYLLIHLLIIFFFTNLYYFLARYSEEKGYHSEDGKKFGESWERDLYYTVMTHFTIGFGDITPQSKLFKRLTMCQVLLAFLFFNL